MWFGGRRLGCVRVGSTHRPAAESLGSPLVPMDQLRCRERPPLLLGVAGPAKTLLVSSQLSPGEAQELVSYN